MRVLLLSPPFVKEYMRNARCDFVSLSATQWYPLLLGYCGAWLEKQGHTVKLIDAPAQYLGHAETERLSAEFKPDLLVLYTGRLSEANDLRFGDAVVARTGCDAVIVGPFASIAPAATLARAERIGKLVTGEFEHPVAELAAGDDPDGIANLVRREDGGRGRNAPRPHLSRAQLDAIPFVSRFFRDHADIRAYKTPSEYYPFMDIMTGRGCAWGQCTYCLWVHAYVTGATYNTRSVENVIGEFEFIARDMPAVRSVMIQDDTFTQGRAAEFAEAKLKAGNRLPWSCYARGNMSFEAMALMKRAGCRNLHVGYESADPEVLKTIRKGVGAERMTQFTRDAKRAGLRIHGDFALGFPGETPESARRTIAWACRLNPDTAQFQLMIPFPGTPYHALMRERGWLNAEGQPDMPRFTNAEIRALAKQAYRAFYLHPRYVWKCLRHPYEHFFGRLRTIFRAVPAMFWKRWKTG
ncbi:MAG: radical SAM protein [Lentisphaerae bacterium]|nr:radical SAM protein [Lentisphaerota bacterium]